MDNYEKVTNICHNCNKRGKNCFPICNKCIGSFFLLMTNKNCFQTHIKYDCKICRCMQMYLPPTIGGTCRRMSMHLNTKDEIPYGLYFIKRKDYLIGLSRFINPTNYEYYYNLKKNKKLINTHTKLCLCKLHYKNKINNKMKKKNKKYYENVNVGLKRLDELSNMYGFKFNLINILSRIF